MRRLHSDRSDRFEDLELDDLSVPGWVPVKIDELAIAIHEQLATDEIK